MLKEVINCKNLLLVGEGNFSFSLSLIKMLRDVAMMKSTCIDEQRELSEVQLENMRAIRSLGGIIVTGVDATQLSEHPDIGKCRYDAVIFNFPHIKGKMKLGENRLLLKKFFMSAMEVLCVGGKVLVTLCQGQSGTPVDNPDRKWQDTWQVADMAASANLILKNVHPFNRDNFQDYVCSGYRGKDKRFNVDGALTSIFVQGDPVLELMLSPEMAGDRSRGDREIFLSDWIEKSCFSQRSWLKPGHPVSEITEETNVIVSKVFKAVEDSKTSLECDSHKQNIFLCKPCELMRMADQDSIIINSVLARRHMKPADKQQTVVKMSALLPNGYANGINTLCFHEFILLIGGDFGIVNDLKIILSKLFPNVGVENINFSAYFQNYTSTFSPLNMNTLSNDTVERKQGISCDGYAFEIDLKDTGAHDTNSCESFFVYALFDTEISNGYQLYQNIKLSIVEAMDHRDHLINIGKLSFVTKPPNMCWYLKLDAVEISKLRYHIFNEKVLFSSNSYYDRIGSEFCVFRSLNLYPVCHVHDTSFWIDDLFDEIQFFAFLMLIMKEYLLDVHVIDKYHDSVTGKCSLCYRFVYCSVDKALTKEKARDIHISFTRKVISEVFNLVMR